MNFLDKILNKESPVASSNGASSISINYKEVCRTNLELFCSHYFPDVFTSEFCDFHRDVFGKIQGYILRNDYEGLKKYMVRAAPRGHGKSQIISMGVPLWCICYGYRFNILIVSDTGEQAEQFITDIKTQLEDNDDLIKDFGNLVGKKTWKTNKIVTANGVHCIGKGAGQKLRGIKYNNKRPDLIIIDDLENDENVETENQRRKLFNWFMKALLKCGYTDTIFIYIGTILHYEALLYKVLYDKEFAMWDRKIYKAVYEFSTSEHWDKWTEIITDVSLSTPAETAYRYYQKYKKVMLKNVVCLWPEKEDDYYYNLMVEKVMDEDSFNSEQQNDPMTEDSRDFKEAWLITNTYDTLPEIVEVYGAVDPSLGKNRRSDTSAIIMVGRGIDNYLYVLEADIKRRKPDDIIADMTHHVVKYHSVLKGFIVETNVMQKFFASTVKQKFIDNGLYINWIETESNRANNKDIEIRSMVPKIKHGYIKFNKTHVILWNQLKNYPKGKDDGPDALQMCVNKFEGSASTFIFTSMPQQSSGSNNRNIINLSRFMNRR